MPDPTLNLHTFEDGDSFDTDEALAFLNDNFLMIMAKFGSLTADDMSGGVLDPEGAVDMKSHLIAQVAQVLGVVNMREKVRAGFTINQVMATMTSGGIIYIPSGFSVGVTTPILMKDDVQIIGVGRGSVISANSSANGGPWPTAGFNVVEDNGARRWALRHLRIIGKGGPFFNTGHGIRIDNLLTAADVEIDHVVFGPDVNTNNTSNAIPQKAVFLSSSENVKIYGCQFVRQGESAVYTNACTNITISENHFQQSGSRGVEMKDTDWSLVERNRIQRSELESVRLDGTSHVTLHENGFFNASTRSGGNASSVFGIGTKGMLVHECHFEDKSEDARVSTQYQLEHDATLKAENAIVTANWFGATTNTPALGKVINFSEAVNNVSTSVAGESGFVKDENTVTTYEQARFRRGAYRGGFGHNWQGGNEHIPGFGDADAPWGTDTPQRKSRENLTQVGIKEVPGGNWGTTIPIAFWSETGLVSDAEPLSFDETIEKIANPGSTLTPSVHYSGHTNLRDEVGAIHGTFNVYERGAGQDSANPAGLVVRPTASGGVPIGAIALFLDLIGGATTEDITGPIRHFPDMWGSQLTPGFNGRWTRRDNVLAAFITFETPYSNIEEDGLGDVVVVRSGVSNQEVSIQGSPEQSRHYPVPTWVTIHI